WLQDYDKEIAKKYGNEKVLLLLDNCKSHKIDGLTLSNVDVHFLPPNTTSKIQLMDAGIIMLFKRHYHSLHIRWILNQVQEEKDIKDLKLNVLQVINYVIKSWDEIISETIQNCWNYTNILSNISDTELSVNDNTLTLKELAQDITAFNLPNMMSAEKFLNNSNEKITYEAPNDDKIIQKIIELYKKTPEEQIESDEDVDDSTESLIISASNASK
ncbi:1866_t:CDS:1, partial [Cetraspora pellucida]